MNRLFVFAGAVAGMVIANYFESTTAVWLIFILAAWFVSNEDNKK